MATADRLYELACECRDSEARLDRLILEHERYEAVERAAHELIEAIDDDRLCGRLPALTDRAARAASALESLLS